MASHVLELTLVRLKLATLGNAFRRSPAQVFGLVVAITTGLAVSWIIARTLADLHFEPLDAEGIIVTTGSFVMVLSIALPLVFGADDRLDPRSLSILGMPPLRLALGLGLASLVGLPTLLVLMIAIGAAAAWRDDPVALAFAVTAVPLIVVTAALTMRVATTIASLALSNRRERELTSLIALGAVAVLSPLAVLAASSEGRDVPLSLLRPLGDVLGVTPLGFLWAAPADAAAGEVGSAVGKLVSGAVWIVVLAVAWWLLVRVAFVRMPRERVDPTRVGLGWFRTMPGTPAGAVAARSLSYWGRDPRYIVSLAIVPFVPAIIVGILVVPGVPLEPLALLPVPIMCLFIGWSTLHNDLAYDHTALWTHLAAGVRGPSDRLGRSIPPLLLGMLVIAIGSPFAMWGYGDLGMLPALLGVSGSVLLVSIGVSSIASVVGPYPAAHPGSSAFQHPQGGESGSFTSQSLSILAVLALSAPTVWFGWNALQHGGDYGVRTLALGLAIGTVVYIAGILVGGWLFDRRSPELLAFTMRT